ncbi:hypothetical protein [Pantoea agglomerans]|uniref:hypothetical protein n=1 Tax=Enterobacter agglomerans TaxID=549 RepID=UPI001FD66407|nr:hypothetical protein [Pantoea agglomerans]UOV19274.1 hypothetical protein LZ609_04655 [Pantoea agglomerans]
MSEGSFDHSCIEKVHVTDKIDEVNAAIEKGWVIIKAVDSTIAWEDGGKTSVVQYHMGKLKKLPS